MWRGGLHKLEQNPISYDCHSLLSFHHLSELTDLERVQIIHFSYFQDSFPHFVYLWSRGELSHLQARIQQLLPTGGIPTFPAAPNKHGDLSCAHTSVPLKLQVELASLSWDIPLPHHNRFVIVSI